LIAVLTLVIQVQSKDDGDSAKGRLLPSNEKTAAVTAGALGLGVGLVGSLLVGKIVEDSTKCNPDNVGNLIPDILGIRKDNCRNVPYHGDQYLGPSNQYVGPNNQYRGPSNQYVGPNNQYVGSNSQYKGASSQFQVPVSSDEYTYKEEYHHHQYQQTNQFNGNQGSYPVQYHASPQPSINTYQNPTNQYQVIKVVTSSSSSGQPSINTFQKLGPQSQRIAPNKFRTGLTSVRRDRQRSLGVRQLLKGSYSQTAPYKARVNSVRTGGLDVEILDL